MIQNNISSDASADDDGGTGHQINVAEADIWVDAPNGDFRLTADSAARGTGVTIAAITKDIVGTAVPQGANHSVGAYEFPIQLVVRSAAKAVAHSPARRVTRS